MSEHGRPSGRQSRRSRSVPPHVIEQKRRLAEYKAKTTPEERRRISALLCGANPDAGPRELRQLAAKQLPLFEIVLGGGSAAHLFGGGTCCFCARELDGDQAVWTFDSRLRCRGVGCVRAERLLQEKAA